MLFRSVAATRADDAVTPASWQPPEAAVAASMPPVRMLPVAGDYVVQTGDSWGALADRAYGDGRLYRALFAWNRARDPRVRQVTASLAAWPGHSASATSCLLTTSPG